MTTKARDIYFELVLADWERFTSVPELIDESRYPITQVKSHVHAQNFLPGNFFPLFEDVEDREWIKNNAPDSLPCGQEDAFNEGGLADFCRNLPLLQKMMNFLGKMHMLTPHEWHTFTLNKGKKELSEDSQETVKVMDGSIRVKTRGCTTHL